MFIYYAAIAERLLEAEGRRLHIDLAVGRPDQFPAARDFAYTTDETMPIRIVVAPKLERQEDARIIGIVLHEFAHAWLMLRGDTEHSERTADTFAERLFGRHIYYDADDVQTVDPRRPGTRSVRPDYLG